MESRNKGSVKAKKPPKVWEFSSSQRVIGVDEVGVGPIAGPVTACAVLLRPQVTGRDLPDVDDSKKMTDKRRAEAVPEILRLAAHWYVAWADTGRTDRDGPHKVRFELMAECALKVAEMASTTDGLFVVVDGDKRLNRIRLPQVALVKGDNKCLEVACASVVAKHCRDQHMIKLSRQYPGYWWHKNKGYPTEQHAEAIEKMGLTPVHRTTMAETFIRRRQGKPSMLDVVVSTMMKHDPVLLGLKAGRNVKRK